MSEDRNESGTEALPTLTRKPERYPAVAELSEYICSVHGDIGGAVFSYTITLPGEPVPLRGEVGDLVTLPRGTVTIDTFCGLCMVEELRRSPVAGITVVQPPPSAEKPAELGRPKRVRLKSDHRWVGKAGSEHRVVEGIFPRGQDPDLYHLRGRDDELYWFPADYCEVVEWWPVKKPPEEPADPCADRDKEIWLIGLDGSRPRVVRCANWVLADWRFDAALHSWELRLIEGRAFHETIDGAKFWEVAKRGQRLLTGDRPNG